MDQLKKQVNKDVDQLKKRVEVLENKAQKTNVEGKKTTTEPDSGFCCNAPKGQYTSMDMDSGITYGNNLSDYGYYTCSGASNNNVDDSSRSGSHAHVVSPLLNNLERLSIKNSIDEKMTLSQTKSQVVGHIKTVETMQESITRHAVTMEEVKLRQNTLDIKTTHGIFIWKIPEINRRFGDAQARRTLSLYSPPFHTSAHGYRICIKAYLNGDGSGKGTHISVFFILMKSEHDSLLPWPFKHLVTLQLINQNYPWSRNLYPTFTVQASNSQSLK